MKSEIKRSSHELAALEHALPMGMAIGGLFFISTSKVGGWAGGLAAPVLPPQAAEASACLHHCGGLLLGGVGVAPATVSRSDFPCA